MDEMTILLYSLFEALVAMLGKGVAPSDDECQAITESMYRRLQTQID